jgi:hypothetical protein
MGTLRAATEELQATASGWGTMAGQLTDTTPTVPGVPFQPSTAAVTAIHAGVTAASGVLTARTVITAVKATAYTQHEAASADLLNALGEAL